MAYAPAPPPTDPKQLQTYLRSEFERIAAELRTPTVTLETLYVAPAKPREGMIVLCDGTHWNPGSGAGFYGYHGGAWSKLG